MVYKQDFYIRSSVTELEELKSPEIYLPTCEITQLSLSFCRVILNTAVDCVFVARIYSTNSLRFLQMKETELKQLLTQNVVSLITFTDPSDTLPVFSYTFQAVTG